MNAYYLHIGASILPRTVGHPLTLAEAMRRAYGHRYAVVYRVLGDKPVPIIADAGADEIVFVPTAHRLHRDAIDWEAGYARARNRSARGGRASRPAHARRRTRRGSPGRDSTNGAALEGP